MRALPLAVAVLAVAGCAAPSDLGQQAACGPCDSHLVFTDHGAMAYDGDPSGQSDSRILWCPASSDAVVSTRAQLQTGRVTVRVSASGPVEPPDAPHRTLLEWNVTAPAAVDEARTVPAAPENFHGNFFVAVTWGADLAGPQARLGFAGNFTVVADCSPPPGTAPP